MLTTILMYFQTENLDGDNTFHSTCQIFSANIPDHITQGSFGKTIERRLHWHKTIQEGEELMVQYPIARLIFLLKSLHSPHTS